MIVPAPLGRAQSASGHGLSASPLPDRIDPVALPLDPRLLRRFGVLLALRLGVLPWRRIGGRVVVLCATPPEPETTAMLELTGFERPLCANCAPEALRIALLPLAEPALLLRAETQVPLHQSCRLVGRKPLCLLLIVALIVTALSVALAPWAAFALLRALCAVTLFINTALKLAAAVASFKRAPRHRLLAPPATDVMPVVSMLVPLYREGTMLVPLLERLNRLDYPRDRLDLCLIVETCDTEPRAALSYQRLYLLNSGRSREVMCPRFAMHAFRVSQQPSTIPRHWDGSVPRGVRASGRWYQT